MSDIVGLGFQYTANRDLQDRQIAAQKDMQRDAQAYNTLMFNQANAYNSPAAQMERFRSAGLNPSLIYGKDSASVAPPSVAAGTASGASVSSPSLLESAQIGLLNAQKENIVADTVKKEAETHLTESEKTFQENVETYFYNSQAMLIQQQTATEYQRGLQIAIDNFANGYRPPLYKDSEGNNIFDDKDYSREYFTNQKAFIANRRDVLNTYHLNSQDVKYIDSVFSAMVTHDKQAFDTATDELKAKSAPLKAMSENEWMQFLNYLFDKLAPPALQLSGYLLRRR